jgi:hypothetical protein
MQRMKQFKPTPPSNSDKKVEFKLEPDYLDPSLPQPELPYIRLPESTDVAFLLSALPDLISFQPRHLFTYDSTGTKRLLPREMILRDLGGFWSEDTESVVYYA